MSAIDNVTQAAAQTLYDHLKAKGVKDNVAIALIINSSYESGCNPSAQETGGTGVGLWQWSFEQATNIWQQGLYGDMDGQIDYLLRNVPDQWIGIHSGWSDFNQFLTSDYDPATLTRFFLQDWERAAGQYERMRYANAPQDVEDIKGIITLKGDSGDNNGGVPDKKPQGKERPQQITLNGKPCYLRNNQLWEVGGGLIMTRFGDYFYPAQRRPERNNNTGDNNGGDNSGGGSSDVSDKLAWLNSILGQTVGYPSTGSYGQCYGLVQAYCDHFNLGHQLIGGVAAADIGTDYPWESWGWHVQLSPNINDIKAGDIVCISTNPYSPAYGHVVIAGDNGSYFDQNGGGNDEYVTHRDNMAHIESYAHFTARIWQ